MDIENFEYLKNLLKTLGFGEKLFPALEQQILTAGKEFKLEYPEGKGNEKMEALLHFKRSEKNERVFFNTYDAKITTPDGTTKQHTFYRDKGITIQEAEKLLKGESIDKQLYNKQNEPYDARLKLAYNSEEEKYVLKYTYGKSLQQEIEKEQAQRQDKKQEVNREEKQEQKQDKAKEVTEQKIETEKEEKKTSRRKSHDQGLSM